MIGNDFMHEHEMRIHAFLGNDTERSKNNSERYRQYLIAHLALPLIVTGTEDLPWEEPYLFGGWDKREYERLKLERPVHTDTFELLSLEGLKWCKAKRCANSRLCRHQLRPVYGTRRTKPCNWRAARRGAAPAAAPKTARQHPPPRALFSTRPTTKIR